LVHPLATESVNWISGRSDPLATFFCLLALCLMLRFIDGSSVILAWPAALLLLAGGLSKEVAVALFPAVIVFLLIYRGGDPTGRRRLPPGWRFSVCVPFLLGLFGYLYLRTSSLQQIDRGLSKVAAVTEAESIGTRLVEMTTAFGFYVKKLWIPQPLSFAIDEVAPGYLWVGILALALLIGLVARRDLVAGLVLCLTFTIGPALLNATLRIAWTPYAERYLYLPAAFSCMTLLLAAVPPCTRFSRLPTILFVVLFLLYLPTTVQRNLLWGDTNAFAQVTYEQNSQNPSVINMYAIALAGDESYEKARQEFTKALRLNPDYLNTYETWARMELYVNDPLAARDVLEPFFAGEISTNRKIEKIICEIESLLENTAINRQIQPRSVGSQSLIH
ncbi:MAG: hypothetical protein RQ723_11440, partial [Desulfuromonadales bacterium]|nr:hypothetical protein [Desulfuromonadales bacterium]